MKIQELRYGNIVDTKFGNGVFVGYNPTHKTAHVMLNSVMESFDMSELKPIPFSKEWSQIIELDWCVYVNYLGSWTFQIGEVNNTINIDFRHVHEIQNIHYAIYGEELTINQ